MAASGTVVVQASQFSGRQQHTPCGEAGLPKPASRPPMTPIELPSPLMHWSCRGPRKVLFDALSVAAGLSTGMGESFPRPIPGEELEAWFIFAMIQWERQRAQKIDQGEVSEYTNWGRHRSTKGSMMRCGICVFSWWAGRGVLV